MLLAAGAASGERWLANRRAGLARLIKGLSYAAVTIGAALIIAIALPAAPVNSAWWNFSSGANPDVKDEIGWPDLVQTVTQIYNGLPDSERTQAGVFTNNYGETGAINMYGPALGLPAALSGVNSYWLRGYGSQPPQTLIVLGYQQDDIRRYFDSCTLAGHITNTYGVINEEFKVADIFVCRGMRESWEAFWQHIQHFG